jgi:O-antigen/teichoic acid export membrane protein
VAEPNISIRHGVNWIGLAQVGKLGLQLVCIFTLARILPPTDYGLMAMATTIIAFAALLRDMGTGTALIQKASVNSELVSSVFWFNAILGLFLTILFAGLAPIIADGFREPRLMDVLLVLSPVFLVAALGIVQQALLERESKFKRIAMIELVSGLFALACALLTAWKGGGVYALVVQSLVTACISTGLLWLLSRWRPKFRAKVSSLKEIWHFSGNVFLFNTVNYFHRNADSMLIGRFLGANELGFYNIAYRILLVPLQTITFAINRASLPAYSRNQSNKAQIAEHYLHTLETIAFLTAPLMAFLWTFREPLLTVCLGSSWLKAANVIAWLAPVGFLQSMVSTSGAVLNALGRADILRNLGFIGVPFLLFSFVVGLPWGIEGVAAAYCLANIIWVYPVLKVVLWQLARPFCDFIRVVIKQALLATVLSGLMRVAIEYGLLRTVSPYLQVIAGGTLLIGSYLICCWFVLRPPIYRLLGRFLKPQAIAAN